MRADRRALLAGLPLALAGCGFEPLYAPRNGGGLPAELAAVRVANIPERSGQLLRRALEQRLDNSRPGTATRYELRVGLTYASDLQGYREDGFITRLRVQAVADFVLVSLAAEEAELLRGAARATDAFNIPDLRFFAADISREAMERRLVETLAEDILRRVALEFRRRGEA